MKQLRRRSNKLPFLLIVIGLILLIIIVFKFIPSLGEKEPTDVVDAFYHYEQEGDFGSAWELFHPVMQKKFTKNAYVTERSHIYMGHYGVDTFSYNLNDEKEIKSFKMAKGSETFPTATSITVEQTFKSKFGTFTVLQDVFAVEDEGEWKIVWEFK